jgi:hypothetical protein
MSQAQPAGRNEREGKPRTGGSGPLHGHHGSVVKNDVFRFEFLAQELAGTEVLKV